MQIGYCKLKITEMLFLEFLLIEAYAFLYRLIGFLLSLEALNSYLIAFELFIRFEEVLDFLQSMLVDIRQILHVLPALVFEGHTDDFEVRLAGIDHLHQRYRPHLHQDAGRNGKRSQDYNVESIAIFPKGLRRKAVLKRESSCRIIDAVQLDETSFLIDLVFIRRTLGGFDDNIDLFGDIIAQRNIVPQIHKMKYLIPNF